LILPKKSVCPVPVESIIFSVSYCKVLILSSSTDNLPFVVSIAASAALTLAYNSVNCDWTDA